MRILAREVKEWRRRHRDCVLSSLLGDAAAGKSREKGRKTGGEINRKDD